MTGQDWADDKAQLLLTLSAGQRGAKALRAELIAAALRYERANGLAALRLAHEHEQAAVERARAEAVGVVDSQLQLILQAAPGAFNNGVTDPTGSIDEGDVRASEIIDRAQAFLSKHGVLR